MRLMSITDRNNNVTSLAYDAGGDMTTVTDTYGRTYTFGYNSNHHVSSATDPLGNVTTFGYDSTGHQLQNITDANGKTTRYSYDAFHQTVTKADGMEGCSLMRISSIYPTQKSIAPATRSTRLPTLTTGQSICSKRSLPTCGSLSQPRHSKRMAVGTSGNTATTAMRIPRRWLRLMAPRLPTLMIRAR